MDTTDDAARSRSPRIDLCSEGQGHRSPSSSSSSSPSFSSARPRLSFSINQILGRDPETEGADRPSPANRDGHGRGERRMSAGDACRLEPTTGDLSSSSSRSSHPHQPTTTSPSSSSSSDDHLLRHHHHHDDGAILSNCSPSHPLPLQLLQSRLFYNRPIGVLMGGGGAGGGGEQEEAAIRALHHHHHHGQQVSAAASAAAAAAMFPWMFERKDRITVVRRVGHPYQNRTPPKRKKPRTSFTRIQIVELEKRFHRQKYLASAERSSLAKTLNMSDAQVKTWFQNRRTKWRRQTAEEREAERQSANRLLLSLHHHSTTAAINPSSSSPSSSTSFSPFASCNNSCALPPDPLCMNNASLQALHNLQPWADDYPPQQPHHLHPPHPNPPPQQPSVTSISTSSIIPPPPPHHQPASISHHQLLHHHHSQHQQQQHNHHRTLHPPTIAASIAAAAAAYMNGTCLSLSTPVL